MVSGARESSTARVILLSTYDAESLPEDAAKCGAAHAVNRENLSLAVLVEVWAEVHLQE